MEVAAVGGEEFTLGFELVGIKSFNYRKAEQIRELAKQDIGVIIIDEKTMESLGEYERKEFEDSIKPLFVVLSTENRGENLAKLIKRSIGVEL